MVSTILLPISDQSWLQATLPCLLGGLGLRVASRASAVAFLGYCVSLLPFVPSFSLLFLPLLCLLFLVKSLLLLVCLLCFLVRRFQRCLPLSYPRPRGYLNPSSMFVNPILCCPLVHFVIKLGFARSLHTLVPVHDSGSFVQSLWALPCPGN